MSSWQLPGLCDKNSRDTDPKAGLLPAAPLPSRTQNEALGPGVGSGFCILCLLPITGLAHGQTAWGTRGLELQALGRAVAALQVVQATSRQPPQCPCSH